MICHISTIELNFVYQLVAIKIKVMYNMFIANGAIAILML